MKKSLLELGCDGRTGDYYIEVGNPIRNLVPVGEPNIVRDRHLREDSDNKAPRDAEAFVLGSSFELVSISNGEREWYSPIQYYSFAKK
jgi:hypothetical protein